MESIIQWWAEARPVIDAYSSVIGGIILIILIIGITIDQGKAYLVRKQDE